MASRAPGVPFIGGLEESVGDRGVSCARSGGEGEGSVAGLGTYLHRVNTPMALLWHVGVSICGGGRPPGTTAMSRIPNFVAQPERRRDRNV